jgi:hypothetical protein
MPINMEDAHELEIELWAAVFRDFEQVKVVKVDFTTKQIDIEINSQERTVLVTVDELNGKLRDFGGNPHEVVNSMLKDNGALIYYQDTLVAFFDIHAYSEFICRTNIEEAIRRVSKLMSDIKIKCSTDMLAVKIEPWILSDSIILVIDTNRHPLFEGSIRWFLATCSLILGDAMLSRFPLRGAIGGGNFYKTDDMLLSSGLIDAVKYEKKQNWLGAILTPKALECIDKAKKREIQIKGNTGIDLSNNDYM